jgi:hypothetical protein
MNNLIKVALPKGCHLFLIPEEYSRGIKRGKAIKRRQQARERMQKKLGEAKQDTNTFDARLKGGVIKG